MKAIFLDRDGVINQLVFYHEQGIIDSPYTIAQYKLIDGVCDAINLFHQQGFKVVVVSNQPGVAKGYIDLAMFEALRNKMKSDLAAGGALVDGEYYCLHHPEAAVPEYRIVCDCRKPKPGLLLRAAHELSLDLAGSWMIGDNFTDVQAGAAAGCRTILLGRAKCELCRLLDENNTHPDFIASNITEAAKIVIKE